MFKCQVKIVNNNFKELAECVSMCVYTMCGVLMDILYMYIHTVSVYSVYTIHTCAYTSVYTYEYTH